MEDPLPGLYKLPVLAALILASGFITLAGAALSRSRKPRLRYISSQNAAPETERKPEKTAHPAEKRDISGLWIWNMLIRFFSGCLGTVFFGPKWGPLALLAGAFLLFSEIIPRLAAPLNPEGITLFVYPAVSILCLPWKPLDIFASLVPHPKSEEDSGEEEFRLALEEGEKSGAVERSERSMVEGVLYLGDRPVSAFMTHRSEIQCLGINAGPEETQNRALEFRAQGFFPVVRETQDDIAGIVSIQDIAIALSQNRQSSWKGLAEIMKAPHFIPETMSALKAFEAFRGEKEEFLCVMDEYGGFAGALRIYDLMEEIVDGLAVPAGAGETLLRQEDGSWLAGGAINIDELAGALGFENPGNEGYHTLAGFILKLAGDIPQRGEVFEWGGYQFEVLELNGNRIDKVLIAPLVKPKA